MMQHELEATLGEPISTGQFEVLNVLYGSDSAPSIGGPDGRAFLKRFFSKHRAFVTDMAVRLESVGTESNLRAQTIRDLTARLASNDAEFREVIETEQRRTRNAEQAQLVQKAEADEMNRRAYSAETDLRIVTSERDRLKASMDALAQTLTLMGIDVEKVARLAAGVVAYNSMAGECENALHREGRVAMEVASTLTYDFTRDVREAKRYQAEAEVRLMDAQALKIIEMARDQVPA